MLEVDDLAVGYNGKILIDGIDFSLEGGKVISLIGPNGSGKSTVLKTITKQIKALKGSISVVDCDIFNQKDSVVARHISMVMTERIHPEHMSVRDVVSTGRFPYTGQMGILSKADNKTVNEALEIANCMEISECGFETLSDGQRQRVMLARAICQDTEVIVLDEPTTFLDMRYKLDFVRLIKRLVEEKKKSFVISLHELDLVKHISDFILCLDGTNVVMAGTPREVFSDDFIQKLYGIKKNEFDIDSGNIKWETDYQDKQENEKTVPVRKEKKAKVIMVQGTMSNAGKSFFVAGLCRIFRQDGYKVAPFKSQNMALNSFITKDGLEMGRAQVMQAEAAGIEPSVLMNPILLKPTSDSGSQIIVGGEVIGNMDAREYFAYKKNLVPKIMEAYDKLAEENDIIVIEGAGSPAEINLKENDIVNMGLAKMVDAPVLLVGDIDRGGVFAQLLGTIQLLEESEKNRIKGLVINKFRGDKSLLDSGISMLEEKSGIPVAGVIPYVNVSLDDEDSLTSRFENKKDSLINIGVVKLPHISNFTDMNVFDEIEGVSVHYIRSPEKLDGMDMVVVPGSKNTIGDLKWMKESGFEAAIKKFSEKSVVFGICGGYQMLGNSVSDPEGVEEGGIISGLGLLDVDTVLQNEKQRSQTKCDSGNINGPLGKLSHRKISGYEIHMGKTTGADAESFPCGASKANVYGTYIHGFFDEGNIAFDICNILAERKGCRLDDHFVDHKSFKERQYDLLADEVRKNLDMEAVYGMLG